MHAVKGCVKREARHADQRGGPYIYIQTHTHTYFIHNSIIIDFIVNQVDYTTLPN